jgi:hypothetical protein
MNAAPPKHAESRHAGTVPRGAALLIAVALLAEILGAKPARAEGLEGRFEVRSADLELKDGVYHLNARIDLPAGDAVRRGLAEGVPLGVELDIDIERVTICNTTPSAPATSCATTTAVNRSP